MKKLILSGLLAISGLSSAQTSTKINVASYDEIAVSGPYIVELFDGTEGEIQLSGEQADVENVQITSDGGNLVIKPRKKVRLRHQPVRIMIPFKEITEVALAGSGSITSKDKISANEFEVALSGSGLIDLNLETKQLEAVVAGSGTIKLEGRAKNAEANLSGSGKILAFQLQSSVMDANISGSGHCEVHCSDELKARISGSGNIEYKGSPQKEDTKVSGSGRIKKS
ncbi:head GIN domain-containing protein [Flavobacterium selenitireducens]|uniref:head GIN domain-containing protein n=1 Tax=Flavobacterium selenitireducens TaxID=2722704 RepID=UPI00168BF273|nr:head GIN domain-containing protein [Flavobacterium selenitireducens]MBD3580885.1 DUF2807 domain-containing protein [Flavobacterium selenitireducens]